MSPTMMPMPILSYRAIFFILFLFAPLSSSAVASASSSVQLPTDELGDYDGSDIIAVRRCESSALNYAKTVSRLCSNMIHPCLLTLVCMSAFYSPHKSGSNLIKMESFIHRCASVEKFRAIPHPCLDCSSSPTLSPSRRGRLLHKFLGIS